MRMNQFMVMLQLIISLTYGCNFPQCDTKGPHIGGGGELPISDRLNSHPAHGQASHDSVKVYPLLPTGIL